MRVLLARNGLGPRPRRRVARPRRAGSIPGLLIAVLALLVSTSSPFANPASAADPSASPSPPPASEPPAPTPAPEPSVAPTDPPVDPSSAPEPSPFAEPTPSEPSAAPTEPAPAPSPTDPTPTPSPSDPAASPTATPGPTSDPSTEASAGPDPSVEPTPSPDPNDIPLYPLVPPDEQAPVLVASPFDSPHVSDGFDSDGCAACHRVHTASGPYLLAEPLPVVGLCFGCHDGSGALVDVEARFADPSVPANNASTSSYYRHPATTEAGHTPDDPGEFNGVLNRHSACVDCHSPHRADGTLSAPSATGWTTSGAELSATGVAVNNGPANTGPTYTLARDPKREYQLCLKCHSGYTVLPAQDPTRPSRWALDKGYELNPANASTHPIEGAGSNATTAMANSLAGGLLWQFAVGDTIRCTHCHGDPAKAAPGATTAPSERLAPHVSPNRGLLIAPYRDRSLKPAGQAYSGAEFALCWLCHAETPFTGLPGGDAATNFQYHELHVTGLAYAGGSGTNIDALGSGSGNAICAECHFRLHSTALAYYSQDRNNTRLVNFAPNVRSFFGTTMWNPSATGGGCTLMCHGFTHDDERY